jgi:cellulose synthase/poly-beta-1,6-N-acetylglucosamine synthase-like glycosyltransferase
VARGEVLIFLDADTWVPNNFVEKVVKYFEQAGVVAATCRYTCNDGNPIDRFMYLFASNALVLFTEFRIFTHLPGFCSFYYRPVFTALRGFREDLIHVEDGELASRMSKLGKLGYVPDLMVATSARRVKKWGYFRITMSYLADTVLFFTARKIIGTYDLGSF